MFGVDTSEFLVVAVIALLFIGPKDLPRLMMQIGRWVGKARGYARHFTSGVENVIREAELDEMEKKWREENQKILAAYPSDGIYPDPVPAGTELVLETVLPSGTVSEGEIVTSDSIPVMTALAPAEQPQLPLEAPAAPDDDPVSPADRPLP